VNSQESILQKNWENYSEKLAKERLPFSDETLMYQGRKFYNPENPPFLATIVKISSTLWEKLQNVQADLNILDNRQTYFHPNYFHITLNELGWADHVDIDESIDKLTEICKGIQPFQTTIQGINCFERIIFAQVFDEEKTLEAIFNKSIEKFPHLERHFPNYIPHISLVKIDTIEAKDIIQLISENFRNIKIGTMHVSAIHLVAARPYLSVGRIETIAKIPLR
jgi:2'-5' RNA ligase